MRGRWRCKLRACACAAGLFLIPLYFWLYWMNTSHERLLARYLPASWKPVLAEMHLFGRAIDSKTSFNVIPDFYYCKWNDSWKLDIYRGFRIDSGWQYLASDGDTIHHGLFVVEIWVDWRGIENDFKRRTEIEYLAKGRYWRNCASGVWTVQDMKTGYVVSRRYRLGKIDRAALSSEETVLPASITPAKRDEMGHILEWMAKTP